MATLTGAPVLGKSCIMYLASSLAAPTWAAVPKIQGLRKTQSRDVAELKERGLNETTVLVGHFNREITFDLTRRPGDTQYDAIRDAFEAGTNVVLAIMTGDITDIGQRGYMAEFKVTQFDDDQENLSTMHPVSIRAAADYTTAPSAVKIVGGGD